MRSLNPVRKKIAFVAPVMLAVLTVAGCGGAGNAGAAKTTSGLTTVNVAVLPAADAIPLYLGISQGFFKKEGLNVVPSVVPSGAAMVPAVLNGQKQFGFANVLSIIKAASKGVPVQIVTPGVTGNSDFTTSASALLVSAKSGIKTAKDVEGHTLAVTSIGDLGMTTTQVWMKRSGADPSKVKFVELGFPEMVPAIERGNVDGAVLLEPFMTKGLTAGLVKAGNPYGAVLGGDPLAIYFGNRQYDDSHPAVVQGFQRGMAASLQYAQSHPVQARQEIAKVFKIDPAVANSMRLPLWQSTLSFASLQKVMGVALEQGLIKKPVDAATLLSSTKTAK